MIVRKKSIFQNFGAAKTTFGVPPGFQSLKSNIEYQSAPHFSGMYCIDSLTKELTSETKKIQVYAGFDPIDPVDASSGIPGL